MPEYCPKFIVLIFYFFIIESLPARAAQEIMADKAVGVPLVRFGYSESPPLSYTDKSGRSVGFFTEAVREIFIEGMGYRLEALALPWKRAQSELKWGKIDIILTAPTKARLEFVVASELPVYLIPMTIFTYSGHPRLAQIKAIKTVADIKRLGLSAINNPGSGWHKENFSDKGVRSIQSSNVETTHSMLASRRGDIAINFSTIARKYIKALKLQDAIYETDVVVGHMPMHLLVSKNSPIAARMKELNVIISQLSKSGRFDDIRMLEIQ